MDGSRGREEEEEEEGEEEEAEEENGKEDMKGKQRKRRFFSTTTATEKWDGANDQNCSNLNEIFQSFIYIYFKVYPNPGIGSQDI